MNTRVLADTVVPARSLDQTREPPPTVRRRVELRSLTALGFKPSAVAYLPASPHTVGANSDEPSLALLARTPRPGVEPGGRQETATA